MKTSKSILSYIQLFLCWSIVIPVLGLVGLVCKIASIVCPIAGIINLFTSGKGLEMIEFIGFKPNPLIALVIACVVGVILWFVGGWVLELLKRQVKQLKRNE